ncbi:MAG TPA: Crp/Fnr family transcriptional regulator [Spirochaetota bacterium]
MSDTQFKVENYQANSFIMVENKREASNFYIIRNGNVRLSRENPVIAEDTDSLLGPGDFFGVISCMSGHARIETALAMVPVSLISVKRDQFGLLIQKNPVIAMKIIRFFSHKLRLFDQAITRLTLKDAAEEEPEHLYTIGEYYLTKRAFSHSAYAFQRYIQHCPGGPNREKSLTRLKQLKAPLKTPDSHTQGLNRTFQDNTMIFCESEPGFELYIIQSGQVKITKIVDEEVLLAVLKPGDIFGEMALLENKPRSASAISFGEVTVMAINKSNFESMVQAQPQLATRLIQLLSERIWTAYRQLENLTIKDTAGRIYDTLLTQIEKQRIVIKPKQSFNFQFGVKELLNMIGLTAEKGEMQIIQLIDNKLFSLEAGKIMCHDIAELEKIVLFHRKKSAMERKREASKKDN